MSESNNAQRSGCSRRVVMFFVFAVAIVAAFLIVGLVRTCDSHHEAEEQQQIEEQAMVQQQQEVQNQDTPTIVVEQSAQN